MLTGKFLTLLRTLSADERAAFAKYLKRRYGTEETALSVFRYVRKFEPDFADTRRLKLAYAYRKIFGEPVEARPGNRTRLLNILSDLHLRLKEFLLFEAMQEDTTESQLLWLSVLRARGLAEEHQRQAERLREVLHAAPKRSVADYRKAAAVDYMAYFQIDRDKTAEDVGQLRACEQSLQLHYAVTQLKLACELTAAKSVFGVAYNIEHIHSVLIYAQEQVGAGHILLDMYGEIFRLLSGDRDADYARAEAFLLAHAEKIDREELIVIIRQLMNYLGVLLREGQLVITSLHVLHKLGATAGLFMQKGKISTTQFNNIVNAACSSRDFRWAEEFIDSHAQFLNPNTRSNAVLIAHATIAFDKGRFSEVARLLTGGQFKTVNEILRTRQLELRSRYELNPSAAELEDTCANFLASLRRLHTQRQPAVLATRNFVRLMRLLIRRETSPEVLAAKINETRPLYFRGWLLEKIDRYESTFAARR